MIKLTCSENNMRLEEMSGTPQSLIAETVVILSNLVDLIVEPDNLDLDAMQAEGVNIFEMQVNMVDFICEEVKNILAPFFTESLKDMEYTMEDKIDFIMTWARIVNEPQFSEIARHRMEFEAKRMGIKVDDIYKMAERFE
jgi:hypothetical protein